MINFGLCDYAIHMQPTKMTQPNCTNTYVDCNILHVSFHLIINVRIHKIYSTGYTARC